MNTQEKTKSKMKIQEGKRYIRTDGIVTGKMKFTLSLLGREYMYIDTSSLQVYKENGDYCSKRHDHPLNLVKEYKNSWKQITSKWF